VLINYINISSVLAHIIASYYVSWNDILLHIKIADSNDPIEFYESLI